MASDLEVKSVLKCSIFKSVGDDIRQRLVSVEKFDRNHEINTYCEELKSQVTAAVEQTIQRTINAQKELHEQIDSYREELLRPEATSSSETSNEQDARSPDVLAIGIKQDLRALKKEIDEFASKYWTEMKCTSRLEETLDQAQANKQVSEIKLLFNKTRRELFRNKFLKFKDSTPTSTEVGKLEYSDRDDVYRAVKLSLENSFQTFTDICDAVFLPDNDLLTYGKHEARVVDHTTGEIKFVLSQSGALTSLVVLPNGNLAGGTSDGLIRIWDLGENKLIKTLNKDDKQVKPSLLMIHSLIVLKSGELVSCNLGGIIKIWNPCANSEESSLLQMIDTKPKPRVRVYSALGLLSNGRLVSCCHKGVIKVWNPSNGDLISTFDTKLDILQTRVLSNKELIVSSARNMWIVNFVAKKIVHKFETSNQLLVSYYLHRLANGFLWGGGYWNQTFKFPDTIVIWDLESHKLIHTAFTEHAGIVTSGSISKDGTQLVTGSRDGKLKVWSLDC